MPTVISVSYGWPEQDTCNPITNAQNCTASDTQAYINRANAELAKLGTAGVTVIVCTQDEGAPSEANEDCTNAKHPLWPTFPGSSPFVTAVGSQSFVPTPDHEFDEVEPNSLLNSVDPYQEPLCQYKQYPCTNNTYVMPCMVNNTHFSYTSGGGFSTWGPQQPYQASQVAAYLKSSAFIPPKQFFNANMRGFPDVVAAGEGILMILGGAVTPVEGTSAATPIFAGLASLLNDYRVANNKPTLGFLTPLLYAMSTANPSTFNDVLFGNNTCTVDGICCKVGYGTWAGWDPVGGLGVPNYGQILSYVQNLP
jgi:tripeptidyl-peptidase-1